jgi:hypothetical protein
MKKRFLVPILLICVACMGLSSCGLFFRTSLTITNNLVADINYVRWNGTTFGDQWLFDSSLGNSTWAISRYSSSTKDVNSGTAYITFYAVGGTQMYRTSSQVMVGPLEEASYTLIPYGYTTTANMVFSGALEIRRLDGNGVETVETIPIVPCDGESYKGE